MRCGENGVQLFGPAWVEGLGDNFDRIDLVAYLTALLLFRQKVSASPWWALNMPRSGN